MTHPQKGFTLVETAVAIGVVAILSGIIIPLVLKNIRDSQTARARNDVQVIAAALASQLKDTGSRPVAVGGPGGCSGTAQAVWQSAGNLPAVNGGAEVVVPGGNTFANLFSVPATGPTQAPANALFGIAGGSIEMAYKGPYLGPDVTEKADPWGTAYLVLGYNQTGQSSGGPIWVVSAGPSKTIQAVNLTPGADGQYPAFWNMDGAGPDANIAVRVN